MRAITEHEAFVARIAGSMIGGSILFPIVALIAVVSMGSGSLFNLVEWFFIAATVGYGISTWALMTIRKRNARDRSTTWTFALAVHAAIIVSVLSNFGWDPAVLILCAAEVVCALLCVYGLTLARRALGAEQQPAPTAGA